jgi:hypothetical protein
MPRRLRKVASSWILFTAAGLGFAAGAAQGQPMPAPTAEVGATMMAPAENGDSGPAVVDSSVGYIDPAIPGSLIRLRFDSAYRNRRPTRAEFFYPKGGSAGGPGLPQPEFNVDYQELISYFEFAWGPRFSTFVESPVRFINPDVNANSAGLGDLNLGFKYAFVSCPDRVASFQFRTYAPTGDGDRGLGTEHVSLEPALLVYQRLSDRLIVEGELRYWVPIDGTDFAGDIIRYGIGFSYGERSRCDLWLTPVAEVVGWTVLDGKASGRGPGGPFVENAEGDTIVNVKLGVRLGFGDLADVYTGYGRALTGDTWYKEIYRVELRLLF